MTGASDISRRAVLAGLLGGLAATAAQAVGRAQPAAAGVDYVVLGGDNSATSPTAIEKTTSGGSALRAKAAATGTGVAGTSTYGDGVSGSSMSGRGVHGSSDSGTGVHGVSSAATGVRGSADSGTGVYGVSLSGYGVGGVSRSDTYAGIVGRSGGDNSGVHGHSGSDLTGDVPPSPDKTGVYGFANQDAAAMGVFGDSPQGSGVLGNSSTGRGVGGGSDSGTGVTGFSGTGPMIGVAPKTGVLGYANQDAGSIGVRGLADSGTGGYFSTTSPFGIALRAEGRVRFKTSGHVAVAAGKRSATVTPGIDLLDDSKVLCTLESNQAGLSIQRVTKNTTANTFKVFLTTTVASGRTAKIAWFVLD